MRCSTLASVLVPRGQAAAQEQRQCSWGHSSGEIINSTYKNSNEVTLCFYRQSWRAFSSTCLLYTSASLCTHTFCLPVLQWQLRVALECIYNASAERLPALNRRLHALDRVREQREKSRCKDGRKRCYEVGHHFGWEEGGECRRNTYLRGSELVEIKSSFIGCEGHVDSLN